MTQDEIIRMARDGIQSYLSNGGFFNPEEMNHDKVRELILLCRDAIEAAVLAEREACAHECEVLGSEGFGTLYVAAAIRARGDK